MNRINISSTIRALGVSANLYGYTYLIEAIDLAIKDESLLHRRVTKELYPTIAKAHKTTCSRVERALRHAIQRSFDRGNTDLLDKIFGYTVSIHKGTPTSSEFIAAVADYLRERG